MLTINQIQPCIVKQIAEYRNQGEILKAVEPVLKSFDGKTISKRIETAIKKIMPDYNITVAYTYSFWSLKVWGKEIEWDHPVSLLLSYSAEFNYTWYVNNNVGYYRNAEEKEKLEKYIDDERTVNRLEMLIARYEDLQTTIKNLQADIPDLYPIKSFFKF